MENPNEKLALELIDNAPYVFFQIDLNGNFNYINNTIKTLAGIDPKDLVGEHFSKLVFEEEKEKVANFTKNLFNNKTKLITCEYKIGSGNRWIYQTLSASLNPEGVILNYNGCLRDITETKEKELSKTDNSNYGFNLMFQKWQLQKSNKILSTLQELNSEYILNTDKEKFYEQILNIILNYSESKIGYIGEVFYNNNTPFTVVNAFKDTLLHFDLKTKSELSHIIENESSNPNKIFGIPLQSLETYISNSPLEENYNATLPEHFPVLNSFMGIPIIFGEELVGIIGIGNKKEGYHFGDFELLEPIISNLSVILKSIKSEEEKQKNEIELKKVQILMEEASNAMPDGLIITKKNGEIIHSNNAALSILGLTDMQLYGRENLPPNWQLINKEGFIFSHKTEKEDRQDFTNDSFFKITLLKNSSENIKRVFGIKKSNEDDINWISLNQAIIENINEEEKKVVYTFQDITEIKKASVLIAESESRYKNLFDNVSLGIFTSDEIGNILSVNKTLLDLLGYTLSEIKSINFNDLLVYNKLKITQTHNPYEYFFNAQGKTLPSNVNPVLIKSKSGESILVNVSVSHYTRENKKNVIVIIEDIRQKEEGEKAKKDLSEKETLLKEIHHRVKNNLQIVSSLLNLQKSQFKDPEVIEKFKESQTRIKSIALIHENLYRSSDLSAINFSDYLKSLISDLINNLSLSLDIQLDFKIEKDINLTIDQCVPCGLIINEVITNVIKYAYLNSKHNATLSVQLTKKEELIDIRIKDNGCGFDYQEKLKNNSLGLKLISTLSRQLGGNFMFEQNQGTAFALKFKPSHNN